MKTKSMLNVIALIITLIVNGLANLLPLNGVTTGEISAKYPVLFTPASYVFSIWGVIYLLLIAFAIYQSMPAQRYAFFLDRVGYWFVVSCVFNSIWLFCWHYERIILTMVTMLGLLASLIILYYRLNSGRRHVIIQEQLLVNVPFSIYLGWISVATLANFAIVLYAYNFDSLGLNPVWFTIILMLIATGLGMGKSWWRNEIAYPLVIVWALGGIARRHLTTLPVLGISAAILAGVVIMMLVIARCDKKHRILRKLGGL